MTIRAGFIGNLRTFVACALVAVVPTSHAQTPQLTITWMLWDSAPGVIFSDGKPTAGYVFSITKLLTDAWPEAQHRLVRTTIENAWSNLDRGLEACYASALITPERERNYYMTQTLVVPSLAIVARPEAVSRLPKNSKGEVLAAELFDSQELRGILATNRSYTALLDALLKSRAEGSNISYAKQLSGSSNILQMLAGNRGDYTIEYATAALYQGTRTPEVAQSNLQVLPIAGLEPVPAGIACPRTEWGRTVIVKADALLSKLITRPEYFDGYKRWLPLTEQKYLAPYISTFIKQRSQPSPAGKYGPP
ncbi:TIGR02285 family protein [Rhodoferax sp. GW822-FHT02A01]|uniref:TIGR02285 family protein n=1 Tax=Rhodoferax sp. GW822-FHT02A01 TaxID=3141537 RepID=UPI00315C87E4